MFFLKSFSQKAPNNAHFYKRQLNSIPLVLCTFILFYFYFLFVSWIEIKECNVEVVSIML